MPTASLTEWLRHLRGQVFRDDPGEWSDVQLLHRFAALGQADALDVLVRRHGPMVWQVCRAVLRDSHDCEDAFQATFLVLVRKAASIRRPELLGNWLYGVAHRVAVRARATAARRRARERPTPAMIAAAPDAEADRRDVRPVVHEELGRLPEKYRAPLVLCYFQGKTCEQAARLLRWPVGTVKGRMSRARDLLRGRLARRGLAVSTVALATAVAPAEAAAVPAVVIHATIQAVRLVAGGQSVTAASLPAAVLARGVLRTMLLTKLALPAALVVGAAVAAGTGLCAYRGSSEGPMLPTAPRAAPAGALVAAPAAERKEDDSAARAQTMQNLRHLAVAMHNYHDTMGTMPPAAVMDKNGRRLLSWRVLVLPYLDERKLFREFRLTEPWDSPHNRKLLARMPAVYAPVRGKTKEAYSTYYQVFTGKDTPFNGKDGPRLPADFPDGTSNTFLVVEAGEPVPWTKPADLPFTMDGPLPKLGGLFPDGFHAALGDGSTRFVNTNKVSQRTLRLAINPHDAQAMPSDW